MKICLILLAAVVVVSVASPTGDKKKQVSVDAPPARDENLKSRSPPLSKGREKRAATCGTQTRLHAVEADQVIYAHNLFRGREPAANMLKCEWSDEMAAVAQAWADKCQWEHGMLYDCSGNRVGQNLFVEASVGGYPAMNLTAVSEAWNNERNDWDFATQTCKSGKICGHWTQLAGARSYQVGCAYAQCPTMNVGGSVWKNALYVVCDYSPPGNVMGQPIYQSGTPCSSCDSEGTGKGYKCGNNLCNTCSPSTDSTCKCGAALTCSNGGSWSSTTCSCQCPKAFYGLKCEHACTCADTSPNCPYWNDYCGNPDYSDFMMENCKGTCKLPCSLPASCTA